MTPNNLPSTPEEYAAGLKAIHALQQIVDQHNEGNIHARQEEDNTPFLYGQDFDTNPDVWDELEATSVEQVIGDPYTAYL